MKRRKDDRKISLDVPIANDDSNTARDVPDTAHSPDRYLYGKEVQQKLQEALEMIEPEHRQVVVLRHIECLSYEEIAEILGCAEGTIKSRLHRARQELRNHLSGLI